jgi:deoxyadenosine/deoxycytidine kinase
MKITIEGNIASGKSTLALKLQEKYRIPTFLEKIDSWTLLGQFYENPERWGFTFNVEVLLSMMEWKNNNYLSIYERSPLSCAYVFTQHQYDSGVLNKKEHDIFQKIYKEFGWDQDYIIYIETDPNVCFERLQKRNRSCESQVSLSYLEDIHKKHSDMIKFVKINKPSVKICIVDGNQDYDALFDNVCKILENIIIYT